MDEAAWNEGEDGKQKEKSEEESGSSKNLIEAKTDNQSSSSSEGQDESESIDLKQDINNDSPERSERTDRKTSTTKPKKQLMGEVIVPAFSTRPLRNVNGGSSNSKDGSMGQIELVRERSRSRASDLGEFGEVEMSETEECDDSRRKSRRERHSGSSRSRTPENSEMNGSVSSQQILQSLPYFHLLPPAIRNGKQKVSGIFYLIFKCFF